MSNVTLRIGGRDYAMTCADGEEKHIASLGAMMQEKLEEMGGAGKQSEARTLLFAALQLADEVHEYRARAEASTDGPSATFGDDASGDVRAQVIAIIESVALRLENCADLLEQRSSSS